MNLSAFRIFNLSVHHLNKFVGAGYPSPSKQTQNVSSVFGLRRFVDTGRRLSFAAAYMLLKVVVILETIFGRKQFSGNQT